MRTSTFIIVFLVLLSAGCASMEEAYYIDREFGSAQQATWDKQIVHQDYRYAAKVPEVVEGITAEEIMDVYTETFAEEPEEVNVFQLGIAQ